MSKPEPITRPYYEWSAMQEYLEECLGKDLDDYAGVLKGNHKAPFRNFTVWLREYMDIEPDQLRTLNVELLMDLNEEPWADEILECIQREFGNTVDVHFTD